ncbi:MAG: hypothetical protein Q9181_004512 [Wetmoreana brouardii]
MDIKPGHCCNTPPENPDVPGQYNKRIKYTGLAPRDIAAVWTDDGPNRGCNGKSIASCTGGGTWEYHVPSAQAGILIRGGNYIKLPQDMPPTAEDQGSMQGEGILGLATDYYGDWYSPRIVPQAVSMLEQLANIVLAAMGGAGPSSSGNKLPMKVKRFGRRMVDMGRLLMEPGGVREGVFGRLRE